MKEKKNFSDFSLAVVYSNQLFVAARSILYIFFLLRNVDEIKIIIIIIIIIINYYYYYFTLFKDYDIIFSCVLVINKTVSHSACVVVLPL